MTRVRPATSRDLDAVVALEAECLGIDAWHDALIAPGIAGELPTVSYFVAEDSAVVGHAVLSVAGDIAELQRIAVTPARRRTGVARALLDAVVAAAERDTADRMLLEVRENNEAALRFYAQSGFVEIDRRPRYYSDGATAIVLRRGLGRGCGGSVSPVLGDQGR